MITPNVKIWSKLLLNVSTVTRQLLCRGVHVSGISHAAAEEAPIFFRPDVHHLLRAITNCDPEKVHRSATYRSIGSGAAKSEEEYRRFRKPKMELLTDEQLAESLEDAPRLTAQRLQMPPVLPEREEVEEVLEEEPRLAGIVPEGQRLVFIDISISDSINARNRSIVSRETDGSLRSVGWEERDRLISVYFPVQGQRVMTPLMFHPDRLKLMLEQKKHLYVLERACVQFEPDHPVFIRTRDLVYNHLLDHGIPDLLHATRHFGPLTLHALLNNRHDCMFNYFIRKNLMRALVCYVQLLAKVKQLDFSALPEVEALLTMSVTVEHKQLDLRTSGQVLDGVRALLTAAMAGEYPIQVSKATKTMLRNKLSRPDFSQVVEAESESECE